jgi:hypothetical protein
MKDQLWLSPMIASLITDPEFRVLEILAVGERPHNALQNPTATITRLATTRQRRLRWPTDNMGKSV